MLVEYQREVVKERREANYVDLVVLVQSDTQPLRDALPHLRQDDVVGAFLVAGWIIILVVGDVVVHLGCVPDLARQEVDRVNVALHSVRNAHVRLIDELPICAIKTRPSRTVDDFPILVQIHVRFRLDLFNQVAFHDVDRQFISEGGLAS